jgi:hypothetical protein
VNNGFKKDIDKIDAWAAAEILSEFPELAQELLAISDLDKDAIDETL